MAPVPMTGECSCMNLPLTVTLTSVCKSGKPQHTLMIPTKKFALFLYFSSQNNHFGTKTEKHISFLKFFSKYDSNLQAYSINTCFCLEWL